MISDHQHALVPGNPRLQIQADATEEAKEAQEGACHPPHPERQEPRSTPRKRPKGRRDDDALEEVGCQKKGTDDGQSEVTSRHSCPFPGRSPGFLGEGLGNDGKVRRGQTPRR